MEANETWCQLIGAYTGGYSDLTLGRTWRRLFACLGPTVLLFATSLLFHLRILGPPPRLLQQTKRIEAKRSEIQWRTDATCYSFLEFYTHPDRKRQTRPSRAKTREFRQKLEGLRSDTKYFYRFGFSLYENGRQPEFSPVFEFKTRPEIKIRDIQVVDRKHNQVTLRWSTNLETRTMIRIGQTRDYSRIVENPEQRRELDHSVVIHGLKGNTTYHYQVVATDPDDANDERTSDDKRFVTRAESSHVGGPICVFRPVRLRTRVGCCGSDDQEYRDQLRESLRTFHPQRKDLTLQKKLELKAGTSTRGNFHQRRQYLSLWIEQLEARGAVLPPGIVKPTLRVEAEYLRSLYYVNVDRALARLDKALALLVTSDDELLTR